MIKKILFLFSSLLYTCPSYAQGSGADGAIAGGGGWQFTDNVRTYLTANAAAGQPTITVNDASSFTNGDLCFLIQMLGTNEGNYEELTISSKTATTITFTTNLQWAYYANGGTNRSQVMKILQYTNVTLNSGDGFLGHQWDGNTGGVCCFKANGTLTINSGAYVSMYGYGFAGGTGGAGGSGGTAGTGGIGGLSSCSFSTNNGSDANSAGGGTGGAGDNGGGTGGVGGGQIATGKTTGSAATVASGPGAGTTVAAATNTGNNSGWYLPYGTGLMMGSGGAGTVGTDGQDASGGGGGGGNGGLSDGATGGNGATGAAGAAGATGGYGGGIIVFAVNTLNNATVAPAPIIADGDGDGPNFNVAPFNAGNAGNTGATGGNGGNGGDGCFTGGCCCPRVGGGGGGGDGADGSNGSNGGGGGAGGSILIAYNNLTALGSISAVGGTGGSPGGGGAAGANGSAGTGQSGCRSGGCGAGCEFSSAGNPGDAAPSAGSAGTTTGINGGAGKTSSSPLPIILKSFHGIHKAGVNSLYWSSLTETNNDFYRVEKSMDAEVYSVLQTVPGRGTTTVPFDYHVVDDAPYSDVTYYKLCQVDFDGHTEVFGPIAIKAKADENERLVLFPNPAIKKTNIHFNSPVSTMAMISLYDINGKVIYRDHKNVFEGANVIEVILPQISMGAYMIELSYPGSSFSAKLYKR